MPESHASSAGSSPYRILVLAPQFPYPPHQGTTLRNYNIVAGLAARHKVHLLSFGDPTAAAGSPLDGLCQLVEVIPPPAPRSVARRLASLFLTLKPDMALRLRSPAFHTALADRLSGDSYDVVQVEGIEMGPYLLQVAHSRPSGTSPRLVFDDHNAEYILQRRAWETDLQQPRRWIAAAYSLIQWRKLRRYERRLLRSADAVAAVSEVDAEALQRLVPDLEVTVVPNGVDIEYYRPLPVELTVSAEEAASDEAWEMGVGLWAAGQGLWDIVFTGKMDFRPNVDAVLWFAQEVLPLVRREVPEAHFWVVGQKPHPRLAALGDHPGVTLTGWVEDVRPYISRAAVYAVPLRIGGGTRLKVLEAMAMGKAIVSTSLGCEGFDLVPGQELLMADAPADFAAAILRLFRDSAQRQRLGRAARRFAVSRYEWRTIIPRLEHAYG
jgi:glycosyltransferase involved in cell wall biosynthesis